MTGHAGPVLLAKYTATKDCQVWGGNVELSNSVDCQTCAQGGYDCEGYATRLHWNTSASDGIVIIGILLTTAVNGDSPRKQRQSSTNFQVTRQIPGFSTIFTNKTKL
jgi:hypothetical protein